MKYLRVLSIAATLAAAVLASGCISIPAPRVTSQSGKAEASGDTKPNVLLVLHVSLQRKAFPSSTAKQAEAMYDPVGQAFVKRVEALGGKADYKVFSEASDFEIPQAGYTHVLVERIKQMSVSGQGNSYRTWDATLWVMDTSTTRRAAKKVFTQVYESNGVFCFSVTQYANKVECQVQYVDHLVAHMAPVLPAK
ncbi:hypothetical protein [Polaromonas aquatica]|uniref:hypothetical protein n=1 Tax=Polaromonas aquatica TaxID=332657 RepID=UPI003D6555B9